MKIQNLRPIKIGFFIYVAIYCIDPFLFYEKAPVGVFEATYPADNLSNCILFFLMFFIFRCFGIDLQKKEKVPRFTLVSESMITMGLIFLISAAFEAFFYFSGAKASSFSLVFPSTSVLKMINCVLGTFLIAFREEFVYRVYLPFQILDFLGEKSEKKAFRWAVEVFCVLLFGFSHLRLGWANVLFAILSGVVLRRGFLKTNNIFLMTLIHGIYNLMVIIVSPI